MAGSGTWASYSGTAEIVLAVVLTAAATAVGYAGIRLPMPARPPRPGRTAEAAAGWGTAQCHGLAARSAQ